MRKRSGFTLIEVMVAVLLFGLTVTAFGAIFPMSHQMRYKSENVTRATTLAQQKVEQLRALPYQYLEFDALRVANAIDDVADASSDPDVQKYVFTDVDRLPDKLHQGAGTLTITDLLPDLRRVDVTVTWSDRVAQGNSVTVTTYIANKEIYVK